MPLRVNIHFRSEVYPVKTYFLHDDKKVVELAKDPDIPSVLLDVVAMPTFQAVTLQTEFALIELKNVDWSELPH